MLPNKGPVFSSTNRVERMSCSVLDRRPPAIVEETSRAEIITQGRVGGLKDLRCFGKSGAGLSMIGKKDVLVKNLRQGEVTGQT